MYYQPILEIGNRPVGGRPEAISPFYGGSNRSVNFNPIFVEVLSPGENDYISHQINVTL